MNESANFAAYKRPVGLAVAMTQREAFEEFQRQYALEEAHWDLMWECQREAEKAIRWEKKLDVLRKALTGFAFGAAVYLIAFLLGY